MIFMKSDRDQKTALSLQSSCESTHEYLSKVIHNFESPQVFIHTLIEDHPLVGDQDLYPGSISSIRFRSRDTVHGF
jgi:hypothetical protein